MVILLLCMGSNEAVSDLVTYSYTGNYNASVNDISN
jgi:hypothetical protein